MEVQLGETSFSNSVTYPAPGGDRLKALDELTEDELNLT